MLRKRLLDTRIALMRKSPILGDLASIPFYVFDKSKVPTAATYAKDGKIYIEFNTKWASALFNTQLEAVLIHELFHILSSHINIRAKEPPYIFNLAGDCAIN